jgi:hypothetical protein
VSNTNVVSVTAGGGSNRVDLATANRFAPGATPESGDDEIEIGVDFHDQPFSLLRVIADNAGARFRAGSNGINTNAADSEGTPDADVALVSGVQRLEPHGGGVATSSARRAGRAPAAPSRRTSWSPQVKARTSSPAAREAAFYSGAPGAPAVRPGRERLSRSGDRRRPPLRRRRHGHGPLRP